MPSLSPLLPRAVALIETTSPTPTFSVITPAYDAASTILATIRSVLGQTRQDFELLIVDDGSSDGTAQTIADGISDPRVSVLVLERNGGISAARNRGLALARGSLISFIDADDLWLPHYLERMEGVLATQPQAMLVYTDAWMLDDRTGRIFRKTTSATLQPGPEAPPDDKVSLMRELLESNFVFSSVTLRREVFDLVGTFDETLEVAEDYDLWFRVAAHGLRMARIREPLAVYRRTPGTVSRNDLLLETNRREIFRRLAESETLPPAVTELAARKVAVADRRIATFSGAAGVGSIVYHARRRLSPLKNVLLGPVLRYRKPPPPLAAASLDLEPQDRRGTSKLFPVR